MQVKKMQKRKKGEKGDGRQVSLGPLASDTEKITETGHEKMDKPCLWSGFI
jgi:hypothetical protein